MRGPSEAARCASTGAQQVAFPLILLSFLHLDLKGSCQTILHCAQLFHPPNPERAETPFARRGPSHSLRLSLGGVAEVALHCANRPSTFLSCAFCEKEGPLPPPPPPPLDRC